MSTQKDMDQLLASFAEQTVPGCGCILMQDGKMLYEGYAGFADLARTKPVGPFTLFRLYSMTKVIVCTAGMIQFERGKFALNEPYANYFPEFKDTQVAEKDASGAWRLRKSSRPIRIKDVFNMACGLPYDQPDSDHPTDVAIRKVTKELTERTGGRYTLLEHVRALGSVPVYFDPGTHWLYGFGHELVAALVEKTSGMTIGEFLKKEIFEPLGMKNTGYRLEDEQWPQMTTLFHRNDDGSYEEHDAGLGDARFAKDAFYEGGGSGLYSTVRDYATFTQMLACGGTLNGVRFLGSQTIDMMRTNMLNEQQLKDFTNTYLDGYGYGLGVRTLLSQAGVSNSTPGEFGWTGAAGTWTSIDPAHKFSVVYMHNMFPNNEEYHHMRVRAVAYGML